MALVNFGTVSPAMASPVGRRLSHRTAGPSVHVPSATTKEKGLFDAIFGPLYKEEQLLETDPILKKVEEKTAAAAPRTKAGTVEKKSVGGDDDGGFNFGGLFSKKG